MIEVHTVIERWYVQAMYNNLNSPAYVDMVGDMAHLQTGVFTCTFKINDGTICDYVVVEQDVYADPTTPKAHQVSR